MALGAPFLALFEKWGRSFAHPSTVRPTNRLNNRSASTFSPRFLHAPTAILTSFTATTTVATTKNQHQNLPLPW